MDFPIVQIFFALLLAILPLTVSEIPVMWKCVLWALSWLILLHFAHSFVPAIGKLSAIVRVSLGIGLTAFLVAGLEAPIKKTWREEQARATSGVLRLRSGKANAQGLIFQIGKVGTCFNWQGAGEPMKFLDGANFNLFIANGELQISIEVVDGQGKRVAKITNNRWEVSPDHSISWDKNYTDDTLEVLDGRGTVVLQIRLLPDRVQIQGEWHDAFGNGTRIKETPGGAAQIFKLAGANNYPNDRIKAIMRYPSREHWQEFE
jgi:hypothetical protein